MSSRGVGLAREPEVTTQLAQDLLTLIGLVHRLGDKAVRTAQVSVWGIWIALCNLASFELQATNLGGGRKTVCVRMCVSMFLPKGKERVWGPPPVLPRAIYAQRGRDSHWHWDLRETVITRSAVEIVNGTGIVYFGVRLAKPPKWKLHSVSLSLSSLSLSLSLSLTQSQSQSQTLILTFGVSLDVVMQEREMASAALHDAAQKYKRLQNDCSALQESLQVRASQHLCVCVCECVYSKVLTAVLANCLQSSDNHQGVTLSTAT
jgi:hypothetical protein